MDDKRTHSQICIHRTIPDDQEWWCVCFSDYEERDDDDMDAYPLGKYRGD